MTETDVAGLVEPWKYYVGPLPDYDHPLACVFDAGVQYAVELLAKQLKVETYDICDGTEDYDDDLGGTLQNIVNAALPLNADGERMWPSEVADALQSAAAEIARLRGALELYTEDAECGLCEAVVSSGAVARAALAQQGGDDGQG